MPYKEKEIEKRYYSIGEVSKDMGVAPSLIRFWEKEFEGLSPRKNRKGNRVFTMEDIALLKSIFYLVKERGHTLEGARKKLKENPEKINTEADCAERLQRVRAALIEMRNSL